MPKGGKREGAGRPLTGGEPRKQRQIRATESEWKIIKAFAEFVKCGGKQAAKDFLKSAGLDSRL